MAYKIMGVTAGRKNSKQPLAAVAESLQDRLRSAGGSRCIRQ